MRTDRFDCGCRVIDDKFTPICAEHLCEQGESSEFPVPDGGVAFTSKDAVELNASFAKANGA